MRKEVKDPKELQELEQQLASWRDMMLENTDERELNEKIEKVKQNLTTNKIEPTISEEDKQAIEKQEQDVLEKPIEKMSFAQMQQLQKQLMERQKELEKQKQSLMQKVKKE